MQRRLPPTSSLNIFMCVSQTVLLLYKMLQAHMPNAQFHSGQNQNDVCSHSYTHRHSKCQIQNPSQHTALLCTSKSHENCTNFSHISCSECHPPLSDLAFKKVFTKKSLFYAFHPDFSHRGASQVEQLNSYNSPVQFFYQEKTQTPHLPSLSSLNFRLILLRIRAHQICIYQQSLSMFPMMKRNGL